MSTIGSSVEIEGPFSMVARVREGWIVRIRGRKQLMSMGFLLGKMKIF